MSLTIQPTTPGATQPRPGALPAGPAAAAREAAGAPGVVAAGVGNTVAISPAAVLLAQMQAGAASPSAALPAPGSAHATALTTLLAQRMGVLLRDAGLPAGPALVFEVGSDEQVRVASSRPDAAALQALVNADPDVQVLVRLLHAINAAPAAALAAATLAAPGPRKAGDTTDASDVAPAPPPFHPWAWWSATPTRRATPAGMWARLVWRATAVLAVLAWLLWHW